MRMNTSDRAVRLAAYSYSDLQGTRLHRWGVFPDEEYAVGFGPIRYIPREEGRQMLSAGDRAKVANEFQ